jgi:hypothetical protein
MPSLPFAGDNQKGEVMRGQNTLDQYNKTLGVSGGQAFPLTQTACNDVEPRNVGLHESLAVILQKVAQVNSLLDGVLQRVHGSRPQPPNENAKNPETPSVKQLGDRIQSELVYLETLSNDIANFVG